MVKMTKLTAKELEVLKDISVTNWPWNDCKTGQAVAGRRKTLTSLIEKGMITISINWQIADATKLGWATAWK